MKLKCRIHEQDYDIVAGATFSEEYNETLDSGSIIIDQIPKIKNLKPYDDVYIWNADDDFVGYLNVGDKILVQEFGGITYDVSYHFYEDRPLVIEDDYLSNNMTIVDSDLEICEFYSYKYEINGSYYPCLIDIWATNFLYKIGSQQPIPRWNVPDVIFKITMSRQSDDAVLVGYYKLPRYYDSEGVEDFRESLNVFSGFFSLTKDSNYQSDAEAPDVLYVNFELYKPNIGEPSVYPAISASSPRLKLYALAISSWNSNEEDYFAIEILEKPESLNAYSYSYNTANPILDFEFDMGMLNKDEIMSLENIKVDISAQGYVINGLCKKPVLNSNGNRIDLNFKLDGVNTEIYQNDGFTISLVVGYNNHWLTLTNPFNVTYHGNQIPVDKIINNPNDDLYVTIPNGSAANDSLPSFFKHLLVDTFNCDMLSLEKTKSNRLYKYKINLMSETKRLEKIILPNISITQPIVGQKRSVWYYLNQFVNLYSPKVKVKDKSNTWVYRNKYKIDARMVGDYIDNDVYIRVPLHEIFDDSVFAPEMSLSAPTLRELLSRLLVVKDCIPVVKNDVIYAMKISEIHGSFLINDDNFSFISESMNSGNYSTSYRREYGGAISQKNSSHMIEFMGFRTSGSGDGLMTLDNMVLETRFPIYKINKLYMCYYKTADVGKTDGSSYTKLVLVKQDITKLVLQNTVRNALAADWTKVAHGAWENIDENEMSQHRVFTLGYSIGSNIISGWGEKISYISDLLGWTHDVYTYIEVIMNLLDHAHIWGVNNEQFLDGDEILNSTSASWKTNMISPDNSNSHNDANKLKSLFFEMDYTAMYSGAIIHSKENTEDDDIQTPDNCSSALSVLEVDGLFEREKINRLANSEFAFIARFDSVSQMNGTGHNNILGAEYNDGENEAIIYHREYQIYDDCVLANFVGTKDYVLKNYFTTVFAKYRTYSYAGYDENINRAETDKYLIFLSDDRCYYEEDDNGLKQNIIKSILSAFSESYVNDELVIEFPNQINGGYFTFDYGSDYKKSYYSDVNQFVSGYSLCFNIKTYDNMTNGSYITAINCYNDATNVYGSNKQYVGSQLEWYKMPISETDGFVKDVACYFGHFENKDFYKNYINWSDQTAQLYKKILDLPHKDINATFEIGKEYNFCKDNKETIDFTLQYELVNQDKTLIVSEWLMKLTDFNNYVKFSGPKSISNKNAMGTGFTVKYWSRQTRNWNLFRVGYDTGGYEYDLGIRLIFNANTVENGNTIIVGTKFIGGDLGGDSNVAVNNYNMNYTPSLFSNTNRFEWMTIPIILKKIVNVVMNGQEISYITIRIQAGPVFGEQTENDVPYDDGTYPYGKVKEFDLDFHLDSRESGDPYEFVYIGQPFKSWVFGSRYSVIRNGSGTILTETNAITSLGSVVLEDIPYTFAKTMYILVSDEEVEQSLVYQQVKLTDLPSSHLWIANTSDNELSDGKTFSDIFGIETDLNGKPYILYKRSSVLTEALIDYASVQISSFSIQVDNEDNIHSLTTVSFNPITHLFEVSVQHSEYVYTGEVTIYYSYNNGSETVNTSTTVEFVYTDFHLDSADEYFEMHITTPAILTTTKEYASVQYWYYDAEGDGYLHFVMGVNVDDTIQEKKIYISTLKNRNPIVYDYLHRECGKIMNFAESENADKYGEQLYVPNEEEEED